MNPAGTTAVGITVTGLAATYKWYAQTRGWAPPPDEVLGFWAAVTFGAAHMVGVAAAWAFGVVRPSPQQPDGQPVAGVQQRQGADNQITAAAAH